MLQLVGQKIIFNDKYKNYYAFDIVEQQKKKVDWIECCHLLFGYDDYALRKLLDESFVRADNQIYSAFFQESSLHIYDLKGQSLFQYKNQFEGYTPYSIAYDSQRELIWCATGAGQVVLAYGLGAAEPSHVIGTPYDDESDVSFPEDVCYFDDGLYISEMGNKGVSLFDIHQNKLTTYLSFEEPVWAFRKNEFGEVVLLDSGLFIQVGNGFEKIS